MDVEEENVLFKSLKINKKLSHNHYNTKSSSVLALLSTLSTHIIRGINFKNIVQYFTIKEARNVAIKISILNTRCYYGIIN